MAQAATAQTRPEQEPSTVEKDFVTAQKRAQNVQDVA